jgi:hypothetical protein
MRLETKPSIGTLVWRLGKNIHTQGTLREGETIRDAEIRAAECFRITNPGERSLLTFSTPEFYPLGH